MTSLLATAKRLCDRLNSLWAAISRAIWLLPEHMHSAHCCIAKGTSTALARYDLSRGCRQNSTLAPTRPNRAASELRYNEHLYHTRSACPARRAQSRRLLRAYVPELHRVAPSSRPRLHSGPFGVHERGSSEGAWAVRRSRSPISARTRRSRLPSGAEPRPSRSDLSVTQRIAVQAIRPARFRPDCGLAANLSTFEHRGGAT